MRVTSLPARWRLPPIQGARPGRGSIRADLSRFDSIRVGLGRFLGPMSIAILGRSGALWLGARGSQMIDRPTPGTFDLYHDHKALEQLAAA